MGNSSSSSDVNGQRGKKNPRLNTPYQNQLENLFDKLSQNDMFIKKENFERHFEGPTQGLGHRLFGHIFQSNQEQGNGHHHKFVKQQNRESFIKSSHDILEQAYKVKDSQIRFYFELIVGQDAKTTMQDVKQLLREACLYALALVDPEKIYEVDEDNVVIKSLAKSCVVEHSLVCQNKFCEWALDLNPKVFSGLEAWLHERFTGVVQKGHFHMLPMPNTSISEHSFSILTPSLLWYLCCVLPICYTRIDRPRATNDDCEDEKANDDSLMYSWDLLYDSNEHGLSLNRFKHKCLNYKSPTVTLLKFNNGTLLVLAVDEAWRDSSERFGGPYCTLLEILPNCCSVLESQKIIYLKEVARSAPTGVLVGQSFPPKLKISSDLSSAEFIYKGAITDDILKIEVWGCGGALAATVQKQQQDWDRKEVEKIRKVKRPGRWDENPDKEILTMAGIKTSHSQRGDL